jgi:riboflavin transporter FmnP
VVYFCEFLAVLFFRIVVDMVERPNRPIRGFVVDVVIATVTVRGIEIMINYRKRNSKPLS